MHRMTRSYPPCFYLPVIVRGKYIHINASTISSIQTTHIFQVELQPIALASPTDSLLAFPAWRIERMTQLWEKPFSAEGERQKEGERKRRKSWRRAKVCSESPQETSSMLWMAAGMHGSRQSVCVHVCIRGGVMAHLQWWVLYCCTDSAINQGDVRRGGKLNGKVVRNRGTDVMNKRKKGELLRGIWRE